MCPASMSHSDPCSPAPAAFDLAGHRFGEGPLFFLAGPCVLESRELTLEIAGTVAEAMASRGLPYVFKASFDKANRSSLSGGRGPGMDEGLTWLADVKREIGVPVVTDVHHPEQCAAAAEVVDVLQIPAFLCRQTDLLVAAAKTGCVVNVKKGQFLSPWDMVHVATKVTESGNPRVMVTERGTTFGYGRLVVDMTGLRDLADTGHPVVFDATHSVQRPGALGDRTGGDRTLVPLLARAAVATGCVHGLFLETHPDPDSSPSDGPNMVPLDELPRVLDDLMAVHAAVTGSAQS
ncbi:MAG: 2-dehydro-3-deoxyphosphooctonate aldolase (KDO 8-P synthase) [Paracoccaceae bacterium]|jgi:2-dehydro-3-deoxyphosphooctonate aldolase (KDO 8-P synthase)